MSCWLLVVASRALTGRERRVFQGRGCAVLCGGSVRKAEKRFGWGRENVARGLREFEGNEPERVESTDHRRGRLPSETKNPQLAMDIRLIVETHTRTDPKLNTSRQYTNLSAAEVREFLISSPKKVREFRHQLLAVKTGLPAGLIHEFSTGL
jgi:hypothetical protein